MGDNYSRLINQRVRTGINSTFTSARVIISNSTRPLLLSNSKDKLPSSCQSHVVYKFTWSCGSHYIGKTERRLLTRIKEHIPQWLLTNKNSSRNNPPQSNITRHLLICPHAVLASARNQFSVLGRASGKKLSILEALFIKYLHPNLCVQRDYDYVLQLHW
jgi:hypothetical protein